MYRQQHSGLVGHQTVCRHPLREEVVEPGVHPADIRPMHLAGNHRPVGGTHPNIGCLLIQIPFGGADHHPMAYPELAQEIHLQYPLAKALG
jgi:hypothetical protein